MSKTKVTYIISKVDKAMAFEWIAHKLPQEQLQLSFVLLNPGNSELETFLISNHIPVKRILFSGKRSYLSSFIYVALYLYYQKPNVVHCHMFDASLIGLSTSKLLGIRKRIFTRHHSTYNWEYNPKGIKYDKLITYLATDIIAISKNVQEVLIGKEHVKPSKISLIHHGFDLEAFSTVDQGRIDLMRSKYNPNKCRPVVGVIARWIEWKGIQYIIPAFKRLLRDYPDALLLLANAQGPYANEIERLLSELPHNSFSVILFENDLFSLYQLFDIYVHTPINSQIEAFGQTYIEALSAGIPSVFTKSGVATEFIEHNKNALIVSFKESDSIYKAIKNLIEKKKLRQALRKNGPESVRGFSLNNMIQNLEKLYLG